MVTETEKITFSFGENWQAYVQTVSEQSILSAQRDIEEWLGENGVVGKTVVDIGCGSGIHSLVFFRKNARELLSLDYDPKSVAATRSLWVKASSPTHWTVRQGSILDWDSLVPLPGFDIVYSWGVLHHTGGMWQAIENASRLVKLNGLFWISIYTKGPDYPRDLALKARYNRSSRLGKKLMLAKWIVVEMYRRLRRGQNPLGWNRKKPRGMDAYHDIVDWHGGLPYEVASSEEIRDFCLARGLRLLKEQAEPEGNCSIYLFEKSGPSQVSSTSTAVFPTVT